MRYEEARALLDGLQVWRMDLRLEAMHAMLRELGDFHGQLRVIHVGGTNGKGSVCAILDSVLRASGYRVGLYTSPHLVDFEERIAVDGMPISPEAFARRMEEVLPAFEAAQKSVGQVTYFELLALLALWHFFRERLDVAVVEVGLGGRLDATNVFRRPLATVITNVGLDHTGVLGDDVGSIAAEKAGILRGGVPCITAAEGEAFQVIAKRARELGASLRHAREARMEIEESHLDRLVMRAGLRQAPRRLTTRLVGRHQAENSGLALLALDTCSGSLPLREGAVEAGFARVEHPGRLQLVARDPLVLLDGAHNPDAARALAGFLGEQGFRGAAFVLGMLRDKDVDGFLEALIPLAGSVVATAPQSPRAMTPEELASRVRAVPVRTEPEPRAALETAMASGMPVVATGSLYLVGAILRSLREKPL